MAEELAATMDEAREVTPASGAEQESRIGEQQEGAQARKEEEKLEEVRGQRAEEGRRQMAAMLRLRSRSA